MLILFFVLIGSDLLIGFFGHYSGSTQGDYSAGAFVEYVGTLTLESMVPIFCIAIGVVLFVRYVIKKG